jgi:hypothetical protein
LNLTPKKADHLNLTFGGKGEPPRLAAMVIRMTLPELKQTETEEVRLTMHRTKVLPVLTLLRYQQSTNFVGFSKTAQPTPAQCVIC